MLITEAMPPPTTQKSSFEQHDVFGTCQPHMLQDLPTPDTAIFMSAAAFTSLEIQKLSRG